MPIKTSRLLSHRSMFCASHRIVVMAVAIVEETDLSVPRRLGNPVAGRGHHVAPGGRGFG